jgi:7,8-dihydropterin-6-yl-methyl-4-(beta-D-ribofuranosyl)aminobenzene 5'-phosphate synthase
MFCTCHCTGTEPFERMKAIMGDRLRYIRTGEEVFG